MPSRCASALWCTVRVWATWRNRIQLEPVQALSAGLVGVDLWGPGVYGRIGRDQPVDVGEPEEPANAVHHRVDRRDLQTALREVSDEELDLGTLDPDQRSRLLLSDQVSQRRSW